MKKSPDTFRGFRNLENDLSGSKTMQINKDERNLHIALYLFVSNGRLSKKLTKVCE